MNAQESAHELRTVRYIEIGYRTRKGFEAVVCMLPVQGPLKGSDLLWAKLQLYLLANHGEHPSREWCYRWCITSY